MNRYKKAVAQLLAHEMVEILESKGYIAYYAEDLNEAKQLILDLIPEQSTIGLGGSETLSEMGIIDTFRNGPYHLFDRYQKLPFNEIEDIYRQALTADVFVSSTNAITRTGQLVNIDSSGNRVAALSFGPRKVIIAAGVNKVVDDLQAAMARLVKIAPLNARRVKHDAPCVTTGRCMNCELASSVCNSIGVINHGRKTPGRFVIIMIAEDIGF